MWTLELAVMLLMIALNAIFAAYELALASVTTGRLKLLVDEQHRGARTALYMKQNMEASLATVQLGITLVGAVAAATGGAGAEEKLSPAYQEQWGLSPAWAELLAIATVVLPLTVATIVFGELVPKVFTLRNKEWVCLRLSPAMRYFSMMVGPAVWLLENAVSLVTGWAERRWRPDLGGRGKADAAEIQELRAVASLARMSRLIGQQEERIILGAARLSSRAVREIELPADAIRMLAIDTPLGDALVAAHLDMHTRFPVTERAGDPQAIVGYVNFKDIVAHMRVSAGNPSLQAITRAIPSFQDDQSIAECLREMITGHTHIALIRDASGAVTGMITLEDIIEELVGDIRDEYDRLPTHAIRTGAAWVVGGGITLARLKQVTPIDLIGESPDAGTTTLNDWITGQLDREIQGGEVFDRDGVRVLVRKARRHMVLEAQLTRSKP